MIVNYASHGHLVARNASQAKYPTLWNGLIGLWCPEVGFSGLTMDDRALGVHVGTVSVASNDSWVDGGPFGKALSFNATHSVTIPLTPWQTLKNHTIMMWVRVTGAGSTQFFADLQTSGTIAPFEFYTDAGNIYHQYINGANFYYSYAAVNPKTSRWIHIAGTRKAGVSIKVYVNGVDRTTVGIGDGGDTTTSLQGLYIGKRPGVADGLVGELCDVRLYNRELTPQEIRMSADGCSPLARRIFQSGWVSTGGPFPHYLRRMLSGGTPVGVS